MYYSNLQIFTSTQTTNCLNKFVIIVSAKINEIHEFVFQCKKTYFILMKCLNDFKQIALNAELNEEDNSNIYKIRKLTMKVEKNITIDIDNKNFTNDDQDKLSISRNQLLNTINESSDTNKDQNINCPEEDTLEFHSYNIKVEPEEESNDDADLDDLYETTYSKKKQLQNNSYKCETCSKTFVKSSKLTRHMRVHSGEHPYKCVICLKSFTQSYNLNAHMRTHSGERPFKCVTCAKTFTRSHDLRAHALLHSGERPYTCVHCFKSFSRSGGLTKHLRVHSGERPFKCSMCYKSFGVPGNLRRHMTTHSD